MCIGFIVCVFIEYVLVYMVVIIFEIFECIYIFLNLGIFSYVLIYCLYYRFAGVGSGGGCMMVNFINLLVRFSELFVLCRLVFILISVIVYSC